MQVVDINTLVATYITTSGYKNKYFKPKIVKMQKIHSKFWEMIFLNPSLWSQNKYVLQIKQP